uniref:MADF domain-containing protein n=1 Tax=Anopheles epiroticus TaxID=199890 RepID=A0A182PVZ3_9DIPT
MEKSQVAEQQQLLPATTPPVASYYISKKRIFDYKSTLHLIDCVRQRPKLWHRQYLRSRSTGKEDWAEIQRTEFNTTDVDQLRVRWKTLRDCFRRETKRIEDGKAPTTRWPLYEHMQFLQGHYRLKKSVTPRGKEDKRLADAGERKIGMVVSPQHKSEDEPDGSGALGKRDGTVPLIKQQLTDDSIEMDNDSVKNDASFAFCEVTYKNKFRTRRKSVTSVCNTCLVDGGCMKYDANNPDSCFLMSLTPFLNKLSLQQNMKVRIQIMQLVEAADKFDPK